jgi:hypothetical protein
VLEYRRFLYLKAVDGGLLAPSKRVDQAWHLHLESGNGAWDRFCREVLLGQQLEHRTGLSLGEAQSSYARTFDLYRREFDEEPPHDIWPGDAEKRRAALGGRIAFCGILVGLSGWLLAAACGVLRLDPMIAVIGAIIFSAGFFIIAAASSVAQGTDLDQEGGCA